MKKTTDKQSGVAWWLSRIENLKSELTQQTLLDPTRGRNLLCRHVSGREALEQSDVNGNSQDSMARGLPCS